MKAFIEDLVFYFSQERPGKQTFTRADLTSLRTFDFVSGIRFALEEPELAAELAADFALKAAASDRTMSAQQRSIRNTLILRAFTRSRPRKPSRN